MNTLSKLDSKKENKLNKILLKNVDLLIYGIEFIISIIFGTMTLQILASKAYKGFYPLNKIIIAGILGIIIFGIIFYICKKHKGIIEKMFISFAIPLSIGYAIFVLPLNVPDEGTHFIKAYDISTGNIFTQIDEQGNSYCVILKELENYSYTRFQNYQDVYNELEQSTNYQEETRTACAAQGISPILYIGTTIAIIICRIANLNIFYALYLGRIINIIIFLAFGYLSIKKIPFGKLVFAIYLCMPMMLQQAGSCSADAILNAILIYYIVHLVYMTFKETSITKKDKVILFIFTALVAMFKYVYILIAGILFIIAFGKKEERKGNLKTIGIMILIGAIFSVGWFVFTSRYKSAPDAVIEYNKMVNVDTGKQINYIKENPIEFLVTLVKEYIYYGPDYIFGAVGSKLGWLNVEIDMSIIVPYIIILILCAVSEESKYEFSTKAKIWIITLILAIAALFKISMYVLFTPVGLNRVCGIQGRYFTPILFLALLCLMKKNNNWKVKNLSEKMFTISFILNICTLLTVISNYV